MLPHAAHAREVVLELRELHLQLALGRDGVLREDVEDQLRPVDDARRQRVLERPLLRRVRARRRRAAPPREVLAVRVLQLVELALADVASADRAARGAGRPAPTGATPAVRASSRSSASSSVAVDALREHGEQEPALGLRTGCSLGPPACVMDGSMPPLLRGRLGAMSALADRLAAADARARRHRRPRASTRPRSAARLADARAKRVRSRLPRATRRSAVGARAPRRTHRCSCSPGTTTPSPRRATCPGGSTTERCTGAARAT